MADRHTLHISHLEAFAEWLVKDGWMIGEPSQNPYEALRAIKPGRKTPLIVYQKANATEHLSVADSDMPVIGAFYRDQKKPKTRADRIRAMSDEELADFLATFSACDCCDYHDKESEACNMDREGMVCTKGYASAIIGKYLKEEPK